MAAIGVRTELKEQSKATGIKTTTLWTLDNGIGLEISNQEVALNTASAVLGSALNGADRTVPRLGVYAINARANEIAIV